MLKKQANICNDELDVNECQEGLLLYSTYSLSKLANYILLFVEREDLAQNVGQHFINNADLTNTAMDLIESLTNSESMPVLAQDMDDHQK